MNVPEGEQDDWRVHIRIKDSKRVDALADILDAQALDHHLSDDFGDRIIVSRDGAEIFLYGGSRDQMEEVQRAVKAEANSNDWELGMDLLHWHPVSEEWCSPDSPLPASVAARSRERKALMQRETQESIDRGFPEYEVRAHLPTHGSATRLCEELRAEGFVPIQRWRFVFVGVANEDSGKSLAARIERQFPGGAKAEVEGTVEAVRADVALVRGQFSIFDTVDRS